MAHVRDWITHLVDLVEYIIPEELDNVSISRLRPADLMSEAKGGPQTDR